MRPRKPLHPCNIHRSRNKMHRLRKHVHRPRTKMRRLCKHKLALPWHRSLRYQLWGLFGGTIFVGDSDIL